MYEYVLKVYPKDTDISRSPEKSNIKHSNEMNYEDKTTMKRTWSIVWKMQPSLTVLHRGTDWKAEEWSPRSPYFCLFRWFQEIHTECPPVMKKAENLLSHTEASDGKVARRQGEFNKHFSFIAVVALFFVFFMLKHISAMLWLMWKSSTCQIAHWYVERERETGRCCFNSLLFLYSQRACVSHDKVTWFL